ncbi:MAG: NlpC/P60 family protein [Bacillus sp. (in: Bacteria)]|nr:NlpC/P60 family protein [Bacillus sp. (in: firmicutes)]MCM1426202.1 NlpC/P60 family protein [Eubacterium sp.]
MKRRFGRVMSVLAVLALLTAVVEPVRATTISELQKEKKENEAQLNSINKEISGYKGAQADIGEEIEELDAEIVSLLTDINLIKEAIANKEEEIEVTQADYEAAVAVKDEQYESMKIRIKFMYEQGEISYLQLFTESFDVSDMVNKAEYVEKLYEYDRKLLEEYQITVEQVAALQDKLEEEKSELQTSQYELEDEQAYVEEVLAQKKEEYENYNVMLAKAKQEAAVYTTKIKQETAQIKKLEEEEAKRKAEEEARRKAEEEARLAAQNSGGSGSSSSSQNTVTASGGSAKGRDIANFALQYVGYPYRAGGTSLTEGADCSGFVWAVYKSFGYSLPRSSYAQSGAGTGVSYSEAQPGDIIYYGGHVGIYIGNGRIVHASTERTGIKTESATYRSIITVRRII